tara:strand:- start:498 stop:743 length:246 start_codon:yes stop_codon:yes gene_type:complete
MNETVVYSLLTALLLLCYLIALRTRKIMRDVAFMQHVVHAIVQGTSIYHDMERLIEEQIENMSNSEDLEEVPPPFKEWDES